MITVTAPTSNIGRQVVDRLLAIDVPLRVIARDPGRLATAVRERVQIIEGSHGDPDVLAAALDGTDAVFWLVPADPRADSVRAAYVEFSQPFVDRLRTSDIARVVGISALGRGVDRNAGFVTATHEVDDLIAGTGVAYRALTLPSFMDNLLRQAQPISAQGVFFTPIDPDRAMPACATRDIADVAATLLVDQSWSGVADRPVLGPEDLSFNDMAAIMSEVLGRPVRCQQIDGAAYTATLMKNGMSEAMAQGMLDMAMAKNAGLDNAEARTPEATTPTTFGQWCRDVLAPALASHSDRSHLR
ncbi:NAD(P)H-binding protein [Mycolicibacterium sp. BiH015]|uniref:NmrA family NAD(P)-binding protein n=1 Tax=Mycolicibacterium sp. BiH015 TaxID=3018808 RepID=UPI0022E0C215|nr:NAD(P)H-binding protein [Mycolicibacterium sp. BiH015]MDA2892614.1 NAD(P)H-binding protein [Mycolicibacterium sp. BiH015]